MTKLIVLRGNSGSGKSSIAKAIQQQVTPHPMLIEHDHFRRQVVKESEGPDIIYDQLILQTVIFAFEHNRDIIVEGIMRIDYYKKLFDKIIKLHPTENYFYYFDISLNETINRHKTKTNIDFGEEKLSQWYHEKDFSNYPGEKIIGESNSLNDSVSQIITDTQLGIKE